MPAGRENWGRSMPRATPIPIRRGQQQILRPVWGQTTQYFRSLVRQNLVSTFPRIASVREAAAPHAAGAGAAQVGLRRVLKGSQPVRSEGRPAHVDPPGRAC